MNSELSFSKQPNVRTKHGHKQHVNFFIHPELFEAYKLKAGTKGKLSSLYRQALEAYIENSI
jgi:hypothetical protein